VNEEKSRGVSRIFTRYSVASLIATAISQVVLLVMYGSWGSDAMTASTIAFLVGAVPHFFLIRHWAWGNKGADGRRTEIVAYIVVTAAGGALSVLITTGMDWVLQPLIDDRGWRTISLVVTYIASGAPVFLLKFFALDKVFRRPASRTPDAAATSQHTDTMTSDVQPHAA
jgi:putative flippase GtrA